ncbi:MAG: VRR-NUC domain-containing protein [Sulfuricellaceae bacterium]
MSAPEHEIHLAVVEWLGVACPKLLWWTVDQTALNGRHGATLKRKGVKPGVPDLTFILAGGRAAFIELKAGKGKQTDTQITFEQQAREAGALYAVCRSVDEVEGVLRGWGVPLRVRLAA